MLPGEAKRGSACIRHFCNLFVWAQISTQTQEQSGAKRSKRFLDLFVAESEFGVADEKA